MEFTETNRLLGSIWKKKKKGIYKIESQIKSTTVLVQLLKWPLIYPALDKPVIIIVRIQTRIIFDGI